MYVCIIVSQRVEGHVAWDFVRFVATLGDTRCIIHRCMEFEGLIIIRPDWMCENKPINLFSL